MTEMFGESTRLLRAGLRQIELAEDNMHRAEVVVAAQHVGDRVRTRRYGDAFLDFRETGPVPQR